MRSVLLSLTLLVTVSSAVSGMKVDTLPFYTIPDYPTTYSAAHVLARSIDGLGFRYHWATEGLTSIDYDYAAGNDSRSSDATLDHLLGLAQMIHNTVLGKPNIRPRSNQSLTRSERREQTLSYLKEASEYLHANGESDVEKMEIVFQRGEKVSTVPFWHLLNGPIADAMWHCGQIVASRRAAGNPIPPGVNVFMGTKK